VKNHPDYIPGWVQLAAVLIEAGQLQTTFMHAKKFDGFPSQVPRRLDNLPEFAQEMRTPTIRFFFSFAHQ